MIKRTFTDKYGNSEKHDDIRSPLEWCSMMNMKNTDNDEENGNYNLLVIYLYIYI